MTVVARPPPSNPFPVFDLDGMLALPAATPKPFQRKNRPRDHLYASELGSCARAVWNNWRHPRPHDLNFEQHRGALGHAGEDMMAHVLRRVLVDREVTLTTPKVSGRVDFVLEFNGEQVPAELKTTYGMDWAMADPKLAHILQCLWYVEQMQAPYGVLIYLNLSNYGDKSGHWGALRLTDHRGLLAPRIERMWNAVHDENAPDCEHVNDKNGCFDCGLVVEAQQKAELEAAKAADRETVEGISL